jgi:ribosomal protein S1
MSWARVNHPSEVIKVGDKVEVFVLGVDKEHNKVSLGMKQLQPDPWVNVAEKYHVGQIISGVITRIASFGAFIQIEKDLEGLIHISELSFSHVEKVEDVVKVGEKVVAKIIKLIPDEQRIGLSLKGVDTNSVDGQTDKKSDVIIEVGPDFKVEPQAEPVDKVTDPQETSTDEPGSEEDEIIGRPEDELDEQESEVNTDSDDSENNEENKAPAEQLA